MRKINGNNKNQRARSRIALPRSFEGIVSPPTKTPF
jgi:hypothetical protein